MAMTQSDGATASQKCDPYAVAFEECESFLRGEESSPGVRSGTPTLTQHAHTPASHAVVVKIEGMKPIDLLSDV